MKLLHINSYYDYGAFYKNLYDRQIDFGLNINVYTPVLKKFDESNFNHGNYTLISKIYNKRDRICFFWKQHKNYKNIIKLYDFCNYDFIHSHTLFSDGYIALRLKNEYGIPYIVAVRNTDVNVFFKYMFFLRKIGVKILKEAERVIFLSESYKNYVIKHHIPPYLRDAISEKSVIIPNGIDDFWLKNKSKPKVLHKNEIKILYVGSINKNKNLIIATKAIEILIDKGYNIRYTIIGEINDYAIYNRIKNKKFLKYISPKSKEKLLNVYKSNDIFLMPSITETFGLVYAESMSQGLPIIYSRGQGFDKQFKDGVVGYAVESRDPKDIANKIIRIIQNYDKISTNCIKLVDKFEWKKIVQKYNDIYNEILER